MKNKLFIIFVAWMSCMSLLHGASERYGKLKFNKYFYYEGELNGNLPWGKGSFYIMNPKNKKIVDAEISGNFIGLKADVTVKSPLLPNMHIRGIFRFFKEESHIAFAFDHIEDMVIDIPELKTELTSYDGSGVTLSTHRDADLCNIRFALKKNSPWQTGVYYVGNIEYIPTSIPSELVKIGYNRQSTKIEYPVTIEGNKVIVKNNVPTYILNNNHDYATYCNHRLKVREHYWSTVSATDILLTNKGWVGRLKIDGGSVQRNKDGNYTVTNNEGWTYTGSFKPHDALDFVRKRHELKPDDFINFYCTGCTHYANSVHNDRWYEGIIDGSDCEDKNAKYSDFFQAFDVVNCYNDDKFLHRGENGKSVLRGTIRSIKALLDEDVFAYYKLYGTYKTDLQKKVFRESEVYKKKFYPRVKKEREFLFKDNYCVGISLPMSFDYDLASHTFKFKLEGFENKTQKYKEGYYPFQEGYSECYYYLTYPKSLISKKVFQNSDNNRNITYYIQTGKVNEEEALKIEEHIKDCELVFRYQLVNAEGGQYQQSKVYGKTNGLFIRNKKTGEIYVDLTESLGADNSKYKGYNFDKSKETYHEKGRLTKCGRCNGAGHVYGEICRSCVGSGVVNEHYW